MIDIINLNKKYQKAKIKVKKQKKTRLTVIKKVFIKKKKLWSNKVMVF